MFSFFFFLDDLFQKCAHISSILQLPSGIFFIFVSFSIMRFRQPHLLLLSTALLIALSLVGLNAQLIPQTHLMSPCLIWIIPHYYYRLYCRLSPCCWLPYQNTQLVNWGCVGYRDHFLDVYSWACAREGLGGKITPDPESNYYHITVYSLWYTNQENPPRLSKPLRQQTFQWNGYKGDVLVTQYGCLRTGQFFTLVPFLRSKKKKKRMGYSIPELVN